MRRLAPIILSAAWVAGCGDQPPPAAAPAPKPAAQAEHVPVMTCGGAGWTYPDRRYFKGDWRERAVTAGPVTLLWLNGYAKENFGRPRALWTKVVLDPGQTTTIAVAPRDRDRVRVATQPPNDQYAAAGGGHALTLEGCPSRADVSPEPGTGYAIGVMVDSPGCATFEITPENRATIRRTVRFGVNDCG